MESLNLLPVWINRHCQHCIRTILTHWFTNASFTKIGNSVIKPTWALIISVTQSSLLSHSVSNQARPNVTECQPKICFSLAKKIWKKEKNSRMIQGTPPFSVPPCVREHVFSVGSEWEHFQPCLNWNAAVKPSSGFLICTLLSFSHLPLFKHREELKNHFHQAISRSQKNYISGAMGNISITDENTSANGTQRKSDCESERPK